MPNEHCDNHDKNTEDIAAMKANFRLLCIIFPVAIAVASTITNYMITSTNEQIKSVSASVQRVEAKVDQLASLSISTAAKVEALERSDLKYHGK